MPAMLSNKFMKNFCQKVFKGSFEEIAEIHKSNSKYFDINYVMPGNDEKIRGLTALQIALWYQKYDIAQYLIDQCHADVNAQGADGITPLYVAVNSLNETWVDKLLILGAKANIEVRLEKQPLERLRYIFNSGTQFYNKERLTSICQKLITNGANVSNINEVDFLTACNPILMPQSTPLDFNTLNYENFVATEWPTFENNVNNLRPIDHQMTGTVNINNLIGMIASVPLWGVVLSISALIGITGLVCYCLKNRGRKINGKHSNIKYIKRDELGVFVNEEMHQNPVMHNKSYQIKGLSLDSLTSLDILR
jgi:Ankyrin repeat